ncbi:NAD(P)-dependent oxidoreductase [Streptomyces agglomeratus]|uniref:SDR family oxidoreductase n=1 Tax=Streptomyces agglomeratus TaxID=285458 RepID=UPI0008524700|nr:SDR family oxidoreductase [Streptomyces agglomeratus]OEJ37291.1 NAD(P)-dependent oxidoreductase [Streptomyces agglomeratus]OEJ48328.1 NAD(P)-dependent oxidoreductase [Streptomyces agglomeratus]OEJ49836.1 NAD(P)-dependent oxidoreductase [Streptomyces agglomeratus]OEJ57146.1 NAD(P)-dependent oxidoreductase [Streptomyces agglomeratus]
MIVVMGATGATGNALVHSLLALGTPVRALTRTPHRPIPGTTGAHQPPVEVQYADATDPHSLRTAFKGADQLFLAMANSPAQVELETRVIDIAAQTGIGHIVKISAPAAEPDSPVAISRGHHAVEEHLRASGLAHTVLRPYAFMQNVLRLAPTVARGVILGTTGDAPCNYVDCRDIGDVAAAVLTRPDIAGGTYALTGPEAVSYPELASRLTALTGNRIRYVNLTPEELRDNLILSAGMPTWLADHVTEIQQLAITRPETPTTTVIDILGRPPRTLDAFLHEHHSHFRR